MKIIKKSVTQGVTTHASHRFAAHAVLSAWASQAALAIGLSQQCKAMG
jgi:hypothetical protein